ncbi:MAG: radical SAM protein [Deltaproteobacteria bacterium]|nr:radical SAM protein [Deltaproteobacteria bacterium]
MAGDLEALVEENLALHRALRDGGGPPCTKPWVGLEERSSLGHAKPCCWYRGWPQGAIHNGGDVLAIWNGTRARALRRSMTGGAPPECPSTCPLLTARRQWFDKIELCEYSRDELASFDAGFLANRAGVLRAILAGEDDLSGLQPLRLHLHPSDACNLRCVMCYLDLDSGRARRWYDGPQLAALMPYLEELKVFGGEPFFCETSRALILNPDKPRWTHTSFLTNGTLVTERVIDGLEAVRIGHVDVSLDAADREHYAQIRLRGNFDKALAGARRLADLGRRHAIRRFEVFADFVIQELNYREIERFVALCGDCGLIPNFGLCGDSRESAQRAQRQGTTLGVRPHDRGDLMAHLDAGLARAEALQLGFGVASLSRMREEALAQPA